LERLLWESHPPIDPEVDGAKLEAELLKAAGRPFTPFASEDLRKACEQIAVTIGEGG
jgi:hypothetical protein